MISSSVRPTDIDGIISNGESEDVEFKASARWDYRQNSVNKALEMVVAKTVAGFLNGAGGKLLLGIADDSAICGLAKDYATLGQRKDRDGYQQFLINLISKTMGKVAAAAIKVEFFDRDGQDICVISCLPSPRPVYVEGGAQTRFSFAAVTRLKSLVRRTPSTTSLLAGTSG
jgi:predicted HTH transcriptional regulator